jgi:hypothetical protein
MTDPVDPPDPDDPLAGWQPPSMRQPVAVDLDDLAGIGQGAAAAARARSVELVERIDDARLTETPAIFGGHADPRLLDRWQPGAWIGAIRRLGDAVTEVVQTPKGPVVETYAPQCLFLLWPPQRLDEVLHARWPLRAGLTAAEGRGGVDALLALLPQGASLWLTSAEVDWALAVEIVLHHESGLRPFQIEALRAFAQSEREATFARINDGYHRPAGGGPALRKPDRDG